VTKANANPWARLSLPFLGSSCFCQFVAGLCLAFGHGKLDILLQISCLCSIKSIEAFNIGNLSWMEIKEAAGTTRQVRGLGFKLVC